MENNSQVSESQLSDLCPQEDMQAMLAWHPELRHLVDSNTPLSIDWGGGAMEVTDRTPASSPTGELPATLPFEGMFLFNITIDMSGTHKKNYVVSEKLNKLFLDVGNIVPVRVAWDGAPGLRLRALMLFTEPDMQRNPVRRCATHKDPDNLLNTNFEHREHVLACESSKASYEIDPVSSRCSVVVPLSLQEGMEFAQVNYKFMCKTSCPGGMNRAPADVIFTIEDGTGTVHGRQKISVKICSCPKRDKEREEEYLDTSHKKKKKKDDRSTVETMPVPNLKIEEDTSVSFVVTAKSTTLAENAKAVIRSLDAAIRSENFRITGLPEDPVLSIIEHVAMIPPPYF